MRSDSEESHTAPRLTAVTWWSSRALALSLFAAFCLWLHLAVDHPFSFRSHWIVSPTASSVAAPDLTSLVPLFQALGVHQHQSELEHQQILQHYLHAISSTAKSTLAAAAPPPPPAGEIATHEIANASALRSAVAATFKLSASQLCHWLEEDMIPVSKYRVLVAGLLTNTEALMPHYTLQLLKYATAMPPGSVFVTIYESGSTDLTGLWLELLAELLTILEVPHHIETGGITRKEGEERIHYLAKIRNKVLEPLHWQLNDTSSSPVSHTFSSRSKITSSSSSSSTHQDGFVFLADKVVFLNDVYFCAQHIHRLLAHEEVNLACGLDYWLDPKAKRFPKTWQQQMLGSPVQPWFLRFYDTWVARDAEGTIFDSDPDRVIGDPYGTYRYQHGMAFPVTCCWNGLAVFDAAPLQQSGLMFRDSMVGECRASECSFFCEDLQRLGYKRMIVDPAVRLGYNQEAAIALDQGKQQTFLLWSVARKHSLDWTAVPQDPNIMCCPQPTIEACYRRDIYNPNWTAAALS